MSKSIKTQPPFNTGDCVISGIYACMNCNNDGDNSTTEVAYIDNDGNKLPTCPKCGHTLWYKV